MNRRFSSVPSLHPLAELSSLVHPQFARHPKSQEALIATTKQVRKHIKSDRWPRPFQMVGIAFCALARDRALIADEMGVGKSIIGACRIRLGGHLPTVIIAPPTPMLNWKDEIGYWLPGLPVFRLDKVAAVVPRRGYQGVVLTTWDLLHYHIRGLIRLGAPLVIADEAHYVLNEKSRRSRCFDALIRRTPHRLLLTGTPIVNKAKELWRLLHLVDPDAWPESVIPAFKEMNKDNFDRGVQTRLQRRIRRYMLRRLKTDALKGELTEKTQQILRVQLPPRSLAEYRRIADRFEQWLRQKVQRDVRKEVDAGILFLEENGEEAAQVGPDDTETITEIVEERVETSLRSPALVQVGYLRQLVGRLKAPLAANWIADAVEAGEPIVAFAAHEPVWRGIAERLKQRGVAHGVIDGSTAKTRRHSLVKEFQSGKIDALVCSPAAKEGITLTRARHVLQVERWWTASAEDQGADRLHRIGQKQDVTVWLMCAVGTIDERMDEIVQRKRRVTTRTVDVKEHTG